MKYSISQMVLDVVGDLMSKLLRYIWKQLLI